MVGVSLAAGGFAIGVGATGLAEGSPYVSFPLLAIVVPFAGEHEPWLVGLGQAALWLSLLLIGSFRVRRHIGGQAWRTLHYASFVAFGFACVLSLKCAVRFAPYAWVMHASKGADR